MCWQEIGNSIIVDPISSSELTSKTNNKTVKELKEGSKLYFTKFSKFPRFKLKETSFKRVIKPEKADCVVINKLDYNTYNHRYILEGTKCYYIVQSALPCSYSTPSVYPADYADDWYKFLSKYPFIFKEGVVPNIVYQDVSISVCADNNILYDVMTDKINAIITDDKLDAIVSKSLDKLDKDAFMSIKDLLHSPDPESIGLGLRLLAGYDISEVGTSVKLLLAYNYYNCNRVHEWNSVAVKQLLSKFILSPVGTSLSAIKIYLNWPVYSALDKEICGVMLKEIIKNTFTSAQRELGDAIGRSDYDIKVSINVE